jgi:tetratricopeptide (TPR) repeat protein
MARVLLLLVFSLALLASPAPQADFDAALKAVDAGLKTNPSDARLWMQRGAALYGLRRPKESLASYRKAIQLQPNLMPALQAAAQIEYSTRDPNARKTLARILSIEPRNEVAHAMSGELAFEAQDCDAAVRHFAQAVQQVAQQRVSLQQHGYCLLQLNRGAEAAAVFKRLLSMDVTDSKARLNLVLSLAAENRPGEAIEALKPLAQASAPDSDVLGLLGELYRANQQAEDAIAAFRRGIELYPKEERLYIGLAALCSYYNSGELGLEILEIGLKNIPRSSRLYAMRGVLYSQIGKREQSIADFERASELSPGEQIGRTGVALFMLQEGRIDDLIQEARQQLKKNPNDAASRFMLAQALLRTGAQAGDATFAEAQSALERAIQTDPKFDQAWALLGKLHRDLGKNSLAIKDLETALKLKPDNRVAIYQLMLAYEAAGRGQDATRMQERLKGTLEKDREADFQRNRIRLMKTPEER